MVFSSTDFLFLFLPAVLIIYYNPFFKNRKFSNIFLFLASIGFYAYGEPIFVFLMLFSIFITYLIGVKIGRGKNTKLYIILGSIYHIFILFVFKYLTFTCQQIGLLINKDLNVNITLPIGISFFTFQLMSYLFDVYYKNVNYQSNILYLGLYISFFPQLIAGPIVRYKDIAYEIEHRKENPEDFVQGMGRFIYGLGKKLLIANYMAVIVDNIFILSVSPDISVLTSYLGAISYSLQIYFDFSGYSDMAIGLGRMFGFHFLENFNYPYISKSITQFWRRWHISLSSWFKDYVYIPLKGSRVSKPKWIINLFIVWALTGIWHGANWTFLIWGMYYFVLLMIEKFTKIDSKIGFLSHIYTIFTVMIGWIIFRSYNIDTALTYIGRLFGIGTDKIVDEIFYSYMSDGALMVIVAMILSTPIYPALLKKLHSIDPSISNIVESIVIFVVFVLSVLVVISSTYNPFIYFNF